MSEPVAIAVFDTNVLVSGFLNPHGSPGQIVEWLRSGALRAGVDDRIAAEYNDVLHRPKFKLPVHDVRLVLRRILDLAAWATVEPAHIARDLPDPDDAPFVECARALNCPLVTGNLRHFPAPRIKPVTVVSPRDFLATLT